VLCFAEIKIEQRKIILIKFSIDSSFIAKQIWSERPRIVPFSSVLCPSEILLLASPALLPYEFSHAPF
jgi:hypothetical protein